MIVGERIRSLRKEKNITQKELARALNIDKTTISHYENSCRMPDVELIKKLAAFLEVDINYLIGTECNAKVDKKTIPMTTEELTLIQEIRKVRNYKNIINNPKRSAKLIDNCYSKKDIYLTI